MFLYVASYGPIAAYAFANDGKGDFEEVRRSLYYPVIQVGQRDIRLERVMDSYMAFWLEFLFPLWEVKGFRRFVLFHGPFKVTCLLGTITMHTN